MTVYSNCFLGSDLAFLLAITVCFSLMGTSRREQSPVQLPVHMSCMFVASELASQLFVSWCSMLQIVQAVKATALLFTPHKGHPKHRGRSRAEHTASQAFGDACLQSPFGQSCWSLSRSRIKPQQDWRKHQGETTVYHGSRNEKARHICQQFRESRTWWWNCSDSVSSTTPRTVRLKRAKYWCESLAPKQKGKQDISAFPLGEVTPPGRRQHGSERVSVGFSRGVIYTYIFWGVFCMSTSKGMTYYEQYYKIKVFKNECRPNIQISYDWCHYIKPTRRLASLWSQY